MDNKLDLYTGPSNKDFLKDKLSPIINKSSKKPYYNPNTDDVIAVLKDPRISEDSKRMLFNAYKDGKLSAEKVIDIAKKTTGIKEEIKSDPIDVISMDVPLFIRLLEYAREDAKNDMDLHNVTQNVIELSKTKDTLQMGDYNDIVSSKSFDINEIIGEILRKKLFKK
jgi:hypothetical protein